jgi:glycosyltransferase involved in cell wall biosynthesis
LVSIITPTYNHKNFIGACIESVQAQTYREWELIIVDDGSEDETVETARKFAGLDNRIKVFPRENVGVFRLAETYNYGLQQAQGELVAVLEGDDTWEPHKLETQLAAFKSNPDAILSWSDALIASANLEPIGPSRSGDEDRNRGSFDNRPVGAFLNELYLENVVPAVTIVIRRDELEAIGGFQHRDGLPLVDYPTILALAIRGPFTYVGEPLAHWRWHPDQTTKSYYSKIIEGARDVALEHFDKLEYPVRGEVKVQRAQIEREFRRALHDSYLQSGRYNLVKRQFGDAGRDYMRALVFPGQPGLWNRLVALVGIASSLGRTDIEWLARLLGKKPIT